jgi:predicted membrane channel-forming protein YqfA (hemolysin III family)
MLTLFYAAFLVLLFVAMALGGLATLYAIGAAFYAMEYPDEVRQHINALFRQPPKDARAPGADHYYRPHWRAS